MGLLDILSESRDARIGTLAQLFGGDPNAKRAEFAKIFAELQPELEKAATGDPRNARKELDALQPRVVEAIKLGVAAGMDPDKLTDQLANYTRRGMAAEHYEAIRQSMLPQTTPITPMVAPEGQGQPLAANTSFEPQTTPGKPFDANMALQLAQTQVQTGRPIPPELNSLLQAPGQVANQEASRRQTEQNTERGRKLEEEVGKLSTDPSGPMGLSAQAAARMGLLPQILPQREPAEGTIEHQKRMADLREQGLQNQLVGSNARIAQGDARIAQGDARLEREGLQRTNRQATVLRKEFNNLSKNFRDVSDAYNRIEAVTKPGGSPIDQVAAIYNFIKMQDPNIVTASEFRLPQNARPLLDKYGFSAAIRLWEGKSLDPQQVEQVRGTARNLYGAAQRMHQQRVQEYTRLAEQSDINPRDVITEMGVTPATPAAGGPKILKIERIP